MSGDLPTSTGQMVYEALKTAAAADHKAEAAQRDISSHEAICAERYENIHVKLGEMKTDFTSANNRIWKLFSWIGGTGFLLLMSVLSFLLKAQFDTITEMNKASAQRAELRDRIDNSPPQVIIQRAPGQPEMGATVERQANH